MSLPRSIFLEQFLRLNGLDARDFVGWELVPGMRFGERESWWRAGAPRSAPHEGLDLAAFRARDGRRVALTPGARIPVLWAGAVAGLVQDFLGCSVFVAHDRRDGEGRCLHSAYGHLEPRPGLAPGSQLREGEEVGVLADAAARRSAVPAHLHVTVAWIAGGTQGALDWSALRDPARTVLTDPLPLVCATMPSPGRA